MHGNAKNVSGQRFGRLIAIRPTEKRVRRQIVWGCKCDCGNTTFVGSDNLRRAHTKSCGCLKVRDITGRKFGRLTALYSTDRRCGSSIMWHCSCDCGGSTTVGVSSLLVGHCKSCGCLPTSVATDLTGNRFGKLIAIKNTFRHSGGSCVWKCKCDCGNIVFASSARLKKGQNCCFNCTRKYLSRLHTKNITGKKFGRLLVLKLDNIRNGHAYWKCKCDCGNTHAVEGSKLRRGTTMSCGCLNDAARWVRGTGINPTEVPFEVTKTMKAMREVKKAIKQAS